MAKKKSIEDPRPARHDDLVAELLELQSELIHRTPQSDWSLKHPGPRPVVEQKCGRGFIDLFLGWHLECCGEPQFKTRCGKLIRRGIIVEVKSRLEVWSAGDVIRQLKNYHQEIDGTCGTHYHRENPVSTLVLYCDREVTKAEQSLLEHERVLVFRSGELKLNA